MATTVIEPQRPMVVHVIREPASSPTVYGDYKATTSRVLGGLLIAIGVVIIVIVSASTSVDIDGVDDIFGQICTGVFFVITGSFLLAASFKKNLCLIVTGMVLSILSAISFASVLSWGIRMTVEATQYEDYSYNYDIDWEGCGCFDEWDEYTSTMQTMCVDCIPERTTTYGHKGGIAMGSLVIIAAVAALIVSIVASTLACQVFCCGKRQGQVHQQDGFGIPYNYAPQQVLIQNQGAAPPQYQPNPAGADAEKQPLDGPAVMQVSSVPQLPPAYIA